MKKIALLLAVLLLVSIFAVACADTEEPAADEPTTEESTEENVSEETAGDDTFTIGVLPFWTGCPWFDPFTAGGTWYLESMGCETVVENAEWDTTKYISICEAWANDPDIDAVIAAPLSGEEVRRGLDQIVESGKPLVITNNECGYFEEALFSVYYDAFTACSYMAQRAVDTIIEQKGEAKGTVILDLGDITNPEHVQRADIIKEVLAEYPDLTIREFESEMMVDTAVTRCGDILRTVDDVVCVIAIGQSSFIGCINAINSEKMGYPIGDEKHIVCCGMDTSAEIINENIASGVVDFAIDQPVMAYNAIAGYYLYKYLTEGESALPQAGTEIEADDIDIQVAIPDYATDNEELKSMTIPGDVWAPAEVVDKTEEYGHVWIKTNYTVVDQSNIDDPTLFSNISGFITDWGF